MSVIREVVSSYRGASRSVIEKLSVWEIGSISPKICVEPVLLGATFGAEVLEWPPVCRRRDIHGIIMKEHAQTFPRLAGVPFLGR